MPPARNYGGSFRAAGRRVGVSAAGNLFASLPARRDDEEVTLLLGTPEVRIARIVSFGQASPPGFWYDQDEDEWVVVLAGAARLRLEGETSPRELEPGDYLHIPAHVRHRVEWTDEHRATVWLAVHHR